MPTLRDDINRDAFLNHKDREDLEGSKAGQHGGIRPLFAIFFFAVFKVLAVHAFFVAHIFRYG